MEEKPRDGTTQSEMKEMKGNLLQESPGPAEPRSLCHRCFSLCCAVRNDGGVLSRAGHHPRSHGVLLPRSGSTLQGWTRLDPES